jgi:hypothetical protein
VPRNCRFNGKLPLIEREGREHLSGIKGNVCVCKFTEINSAIAHEDNPGPIREPIVNCLNDSAGAIVRRTEHDHRDGSGGEPVQR